MERHRGSENRTTETYLIQGANSNPHLPATPPLEEFDFTDNEMAPEFIVNQGPYYPAATNYYGYYCTGFESPGEWDDHNRFFAVDGPDPHYTGLQAESLPYVYYTPSYGYAQSPYNPYNPYIPGAIGVDGSFVGAQQYYSGPAYQHPSSPAYLPVVVQPRPDILPNTSFDTLNSGASSASRPDSPGPKHIPLLTSAFMTMPHPRSTLPDGRADPSQHASNRIHSSTKISEGLQVNVAPSKQPLLHGTLTSSSVAHSTSSHVTQGRNATGSVQVADPFSFGRVPSLNNQLKVAIPANNLADFVPSSRGWPTVDKFRPRSQFGGVLNNGNGSPDVLGEQNRGPRTNRLKSSWTSISVKAYTAKAGSSNAQGNILIYADQFNREDFPVNYANAKFFVIKSYSEDDVHKSIKYNVWSSTPNGNKRLDSAYEDAQRISGGNPGHCPFFLFFSVNTSGQFCGVAEMIGPVDFEKDMDFWQQDKWSGSFPVKWHVIKDVPNTNFRHILLENNENKPVTNSRDTQEIGYMRGIEMLNIFKGYTSKTSILDDFIYYEERQKIMQDEKSRLVNYSTYDTSLFLPTFLPSSKLSTTVKQPEKADEKAFGPSSKPIAAFEQPSKGDEKLFVPSRKPNAAIEQPPNANAKPFVPSSKPEATIEQSPKADVKHTVPSSKQNATVLEQPPKADVKHSAASSKQNAASLEQPPKADDKPTKLNVMNRLGKTIKSVEQVVAELDIKTSSSSRKDTKHEGIEDVNGATSIMKISSLSIGLRDSKEGNADKSQGNADKSGSVTGGNAPIDVVTVGSMPVKVNGFVDSSSAILTIGSISFDPKALKLKRPDNFTNGSNPSC